MKPWTMLAAAAAATTAVPVAAQDAAGNWFGVLQVTEAVRLPLVVHIAQDDAGALTGTMDSPTQGANGLPLADVSLVDGRLTFKVPSIVGEYEGTWNAETGIWDGEWRQAGMAWPLALRVPPPPRALPVDWQLPPDADISAMIAERNAPRTGQGIVVGVLGPDGRRVVAGGTGPGAAFDGDTLFEIGSISKVFTALILADMVNKGEVSLDDPAAKYLPPGHRMPERGGRQITLRDLSTHRSGLPRMADDIDAIDSREGPFAGYPAERMFAFLDRYQLTREIGSQWEYSNLGVGLLGELLARAAGRDYETLLRERITGPLGMDDTVVTLTPDQAARFAPAFDGFMRPTRPWPFQSHAGAGAIRSTADDMLTFAAAVLDPDSPIAAAVRTALAARVEGSNARTEQALGWVIMHPDPEREVLLHDGGTGGYRTVIGIEPAKGRAVVALVNTAVEPGAADLGLRVLLGAPMPPTPPVAPAPPPRVERTEIQLPPAELERLVGRYQLSPGPLIAVTLDGGVLRVRNESVPGAQAFPVYAEAPLAFFWKVVDAQIRFTTDETGKVTGAELSQGGQTMAGPKIEL